MHESHLEVERIARHQIQQRIHHEPGTVRLPRPRRRTTLARGLRAVADRLDG
jgi:hypothetical protein